MLFRSGSLVRIYYDNGRQQVWENNPYRAYLSTTETIGHFGLGNTAVVDSVIVKWYNGSTQKAFHVKTGEVLNFNIVYSDARLQAVVRTAPRAALFRDITTETGINYHSPEEDFVDFNIQKLLPHKFSGSGPCLSTADIDGNGLTDFIEEDLPGTVQ